MNTVHSKRNTNSLKHEQVLNSQWKTCYYSYEILFSFILAKIRKINTHLLLGEVYIGITCLRGI